MYVQAIAVSATACKLVRPLRRSNTLDEKCVMMCYTSDLSGSGPTRLGRIVSFIYVLHTNGGAWIAFHGAANMLLELHLHHLAARQGSS